MAGPTDPAAVLARLFDVIESRHGGDPEKSYVARLLAQGPEKIAQKVGEEAVETVIAALGSDRDAITRESADLLFHLMILWAATGLRPDDIYAELARREGTSGIAEKDSR
jgi:phosphoribosyl-ATP pyrophosphohydrolase